MAKAKDVELIRKTPGVCGGDACIRAMRMPVWLLVEMQRLGMDDREIIDRYEGMLTQADLDAAWTYAKANAAEIDRCIGENEEA